MKKLLAFILVSLRWPILLFIPDAVLFRLAGGVVLLR